MDPITAIGALSTCIASAAAIYQKRQALLALSPDTHGLLDRVQFIQEKLANAQRPDQGTNRPTYDKLKALETTLIEINTFGAKMLEESPTYLRAAKRFASSFRGKYTKRIAELSKRLDQHIQDMHFNLSIQMFEDWRAADFERSQESLRLAVEGIMQSQVSVENIAALRNDLVAYKNEILSVYSSPTESAKIDDQFRAPTTLCKTRLDEIQSSIEGLR